MSKKFKDTEGRQYKLKITIPRLRVVRDELDIDLGKADGFVALSANPIDLVNVLYLLVKPQADKYELTDVQFGEALDGDTLEAAWDALGEAYLSFCPSHQATMLRKLMAIAQEAKRIDMETVDQDLQSLVASYQSVSGIAEHSESSPKTIPLENSG